MSRLVLIALASFWLSGCFVFEEIRKGNELMSGTLAVDGGVCGSFGQAVSLICDYPIFGDVGRAGSTEDFKQVIH